MRELRKETEDIEGVNCNELDDYLIRNERTPKGDGSLINF